MSNKEISEIFRKAGIKNHRLLNKPRPSWNDLDLKVIEKIKNGESVKNSYYIPKGSKGRKIVRVSDGKVFDSVEHCSDTTGLTRSKIYAYLHHKNSQYQLFKYYQDEKIN